MNKDEIKGRWNMIKGNVREKWGKLTDDDMDVIQGKYEQLVGRIQERYGVTKEEAEKQVTEWQ